MKDLIEAHASEVEGLIQKINARQAFNISKESLQLENEALY